MNRVARHILFPALAPAAVVALYFTPFTVISCANRGLLALAIVFVSLAAGIVIGVLGIRARRQSPASRWWWIASMAILVLPALFVLGPLG